MRSVRIDQSHEVMAKLAINVDWRSVDSEAVQRALLDPKRLGLEFGAFLNNGGRVNVVASNILKIDRSKPFDPVSFIGAGWSIAEEDKRALALTEIDLTQVKLVTTLNDGETSVQGEEKLHRLKNMGVIRLDAQVCLTLWKNQDQISESWKKYIVYCDGTVLRGPNGSRCVLCLCWDGVRWGWGGDWLDVDWGADEPSAVLVMP